MKTVLLGPEMLEKDRVEISGDLHRHLFRASRLRRGEGLRLVDGDGHARSGRIESISSRTAVLSIGEPLADGEPRRRVEVWVPMPRSSRARWMVEKLTEVGAAAIHFYSAQRAPRDSGDPQVTRLRRVAAGALEQCGRSRLPQIDGDLSWADMLEELRREAHCLVLDPAAASGVPRLDADMERVALVIGPEGGWAEAEQAELKVSGGLPIRLGPTTLRVETAAVVGAAVAVMGGESPATSHQLPAASSPPRVRGE